MKYLKPKPPRCTDIVYTYLTTDKTYDRRHTNICTLQTNIQSKAVSITCFVFNRICPIYKILFPIIITINDVFVITHKRTYL